MSAGARSFSASISARSSVPGGFLGTGTGTLGHTHRPVSVPISARFLGSRRISAPLCLEGSRGTDLAAGAEGEGEAQQRDEVRMAVAGQHPDLPRRLPHPLPPPPPPPPAGTKESGPGRGLRALGGAMHWGHRAQQMRRGKPHDIVDIIDKDKMSEYVYELES